MGDTNCLIPILTWPPLLEHLDLSHLIEVTKSSPDSDNDMASSIANALSPFSNLTAKRETAARCILACWLQMEEKVLEILLQKFSL